MNFITDDDYKYVSTSNTPDSQIIGNLPAGIYRLEVYDTPLGRVTEMKKVYKQPYKRVTTGVFDDVMKHYDKFFSEDAQRLYNMMGVKHKSNLLLYGPPGTGKSGLAYLIAQEVVDKRDAIVIYAKDSDDAKYISNRLRVKSGQPLVIIREEIDREISESDSMGFIIDMPGGKTKRMPRTEARDELLAFLDSPVSNNNFCFIATTNYIDKIPDSLKKRPSRFELVKEVSEVPQEVIHELVDKLIPEPIVMEKGIDITQLKYKLTESPINIDQVKTAVVLHVIHGRSIDTSIKEVMSYEYEHVKE